MAADEYGDYFPSTRDEGAQRLLEELRRRVRELEIEVEHLRREKTPDVWQQEIDSSTIPATSLFRVVVSTGRNPYWVVEVDPADVTIISDQPQFADIGDPFNPIKAYHQTDASLAIGQIVEGYTVDVDNAGTIESAIILQGAPKFATADIGGLYLVYSN